MKSNFVKLKYYYRIQPPKELNKSASGCKIAFYSENNKLLYHNRKRYAHEIHSQQKILIEKRKAFANNEFAHNIAPVKIEYVKWSNKGTIAFLLEFWLEHSEMHYEFLIIDLCNEVCYRIPELFHGIPIIENLLNKQHFDKADVDEIVINLNLSANNLILDDPQEGFLTFLRAHWSEKIFPEIV
jgi:hypothetical protein